MNARAGLGIVLGLVLAGQVVGQSKDAEQLRGSWTVVSAQREGKDSESINGDKLTIDADKFTIKTKKGEVKGTHKLDPSTNPKSIDLKYTDGPEKDKAVECIYLLEGDNLKLVFGDPSGKGRPTEFTTKPTNRFMLVVFKRDK